MTDDYEAKLRELMDKYEERCEDERRKQKQRETEGRAFLQEFERRCSSVIRPVFEQTTQVLAQRGHRCVISEPDFSVVTDTEIRLSIYPTGADAGSGAEGPTPFVRFIAHPGLKLVTIDTGLATAEQPNLTGPRETVQQDVIEPGMVQSHVIAMLEEVFGLSEHRNTPRRSSRTARRRKPETSV